MRELLRKIARRSSVYAVADILTKGAGLLLLPLYTAFLTPADYGIMALASATAAVLGTTVTAGLRGAALKFYYHFDDEDERRRFYGSLWTAVMVGAGILFVLLDLFGDAVFGLIFRDVPYHPYIRMALWTAYATAAVINIAKELFKASEQALAFGSVNVGLFAVSAGVTVWLVVFEGWQAEGAILARLVAAVALGGVCAVYLVRYVHFAFDGAAVKRALLYSAPLVPHFLSHWVLGSADRVILERLVPLDAVGVYNVGYQIGMGMSVLAVAANNAIVPVYGKFGSDEVSQERVRRLTTYFVVAVVGIGLCISLFGEDLVRVATPASYHEAGTVIPWVVCGYAFMALYFPATNLLTITHGHSHLVSIATVVGAIANIGLNFVIIPYLGIHGAAITTAFTYAFMMVIVTVLAERNETLPVDYRRVGKAVACGFATFTIAWWGAPDEIWLGGAVKLILLLSFPVGLVLSGFLDSEEWNGVRAIGRRIGGGTNEADNP